MGTFVNFISVTIGEKFKQQQRKDNELELTGLGICRVANVKNQHLWFNVNMYVCWATSHLNTGLIFLLTSLGKNWLRYLQNPTCEEALTIIPLAFVVGSKFIEKETYLTNWTTFAFRRWFPYVQRLSSFFETKAEGYPKIQLRFWRYFNRYLHKGGNKIYCHHNSI